MNEELKDDIAKYWKNKYYKLKNETINMIRKELKKLDNKEESVKDECKKSDCEGCPIYKTDINQRKCVICAIYRKLK